MKKKILFNLAFTTILLVALGLFLRFVVSKRDILQKDYYITYIQQESTSLDSLQTDQIAEILELAADKETVFSKDLLRRFQEKMDEVSFIETAALKFIKPDTLYIEYALRKPIAVLVDYQNAAIDKNGYKFPLMDFYTYKELPEIYLGTHLQDNPITHKSFFLAYDLFRLLDQVKVTKPFFLKRIDVSNAYHNNFGKREIIICLENRYQDKKSKEVFSFPHFLRLGTNNFEKQLGNYFSLYEELCSIEQSQAAVSLEIKQFAEKVFDLRLDNLAYIDDKTASSHCE